MAMSLFCPPILLGLTIYRHEYAYWRVLLLLGLQTVVVPQPRALTSKNVSLKGLIKNRVIMRKMD